MKKLFVLFVFVMASVATANAQKFAFVDSDYILNNIPEYEIAQNQLNQIAKTWQEEIKTKMKEIEDLYKQYRADAVILPEDVKKRREEEILEKEKALKELQNKRFGTDGDLFKKRQELVKPIQDKIYNAIQEYADERGYSVIFDKSAGATILYANDRFDVSDDILRKMGYTPKSNDNNESSQPQRR